MSILLYCITDETASSEVGPGIAGLPVLHCRQAGLDALFSSGTSTESWAGAALEQSAREFHHVLHRAFTSRAIIPFRFPTLMRDEGELAAHLRDHATEYSAQLKKFQNSVQMDISIACLGTAYSGTAAPSGGEYLREREKQSEKLQLIGKQIQAVADKTAQSWRERPASNRLKLFAHLDRSSVAAFHERLKEFSVPEGLSVRVSGPWPVTEFLELKQR